MLSPSSILSTAFLLVFWSSPNANAATSENCVEEFGKCVMNRDCCGRDEPGDREVECVTGDWAITTDSTCLSKRSQELEALYKENGFDEESLVVLLQNHIYQLPEIATKQNRAPEYKEKDPTKYAKISDLVYKRIAQKYSDNFAKLIVDLERKYEISDPATMPRSIREFAKRKKKVVVADALKNRLPKKSDTIKSEL